VLKTAYVLDKWLLTIIQNEITAFPELLAQLEIQGAVITADAIHTQKASVKVVTEKKADYVFPVKENQSSLLEDIKLLFTEADAAHTETLEKKGGRVEHRRYELLSAEGLPGVSDWAGCQCAGRVSRKRTKGEKVTEETIYYITSLDFEVEPKIQL
jgi:predicted transposase YbfD/YdcC